MTLPAWWWKALVVACVALTLFVFSCEQRQQGAIRQQLKELSHERDSLKADRKRIETVYKTDTLRLTKVRRVTDSVLKVDTVIRTDSARVLVAGERQACNAVIKTCEEQKAGLVRENANLAEQLRLEKKKKPSRFGCAGPVTASTQGIGLGVGCGIRLP